MQTIGELLNKTVQFFKDKSIDEARFQAERLLAESLNQDRINIYLRLEDLADDILTNDYRKRIQDFLSNGKLSENIADKLKEIKQEFISQSIPEAELHAEEIIAHCLQLKRQDLKLKLDRSLELSEIEMIDQCIQRRLNREPLQYILGYTEFYGYPIKVNKHVLIPRPETEQVLEKTLSFISKDKKLSVLDIGTGSGCIPIVLKKERPLLDLTATDISDAAVAISVKNAATNHVDINFLIHDILDREQWHHLDKFDLIISNPPYVTQDEYQGLEKELMFEPKNALSDDSDGLTFYRTIIEFAQEHLNDDGLLVFEFGFEQAASIKSLFGSLFDVEFFKDYNGLDRFLIAKFKV